jgi:restriction system protein
MGEEVLRQNPQALDAHLTEQLPKFEKAKRRQDLKISSTLSLAQSERGIKSESSPEDALRANYQTLRQSLAADILGKIKRVSPAFFEQLVVDVLVAMGYGGSQPNAAQTLGRSGDGGVDGVIKEDKLGLEVIYIQAKRWENPVGRPEVQAFAGSLEGFRARKGVFITTSRFTKDARDYVERISSRIILIDGQYLAELMMDHNVGSSEYECFVIKKLNSTYFDEK